MLNQLILKALDTFDIMTVSNLALTWQVGLEHILILPISQIFYFKNKLLLFDRCKRFQAFYVKIIIVEWSKGIA